MPLAYWVIMCGTALFFIVLFFLAIRRAIRIQKLYEARRAEIEATEHAVLVITYWPQRWQITAINGQAGRWDNCIIAITPTHIILYDRSTTLQERFRCTIDQIRWFGRPEKYSTGNNEIWLHVEREYRWELLKIQLSQGAMQDFVRALKTVVPPELVTAYRRRRPYVHGGPLTGQPASQDIHGAWSLEELVNLYLMPRFLVIMRGQTVLRKLPLEAVQEIAALRRLDQPDAQGLVRFRAEEETFAFAIADHEGFAKLLAEAAKRTLEMPLERKQKNKLQDDDYDYDYEEGDFEYDANYDA
jgi:hypothetical protein